MRSSILILVSFLLIIFLSVDAGAQCAMCRAVVDSNSPEESGVGAGLNSGILYLMAVPYALLIGVGYILFRKLKQSKSDS